MEPSEPTPLVVCMQNTSGEEVALRVNPGDDFRTFLSNAKKLLGFEIDVNCITANQVSLTENIYDFLMNADERQLNPSVIQEEIQTPIRHVGKSVQQIHLPVHHLLDTVQQMHGPVEQAFNNPLKEAVSNSGQEMHMAVQQSLLNPVQQICGPVEHIPNPVSESIPNSAQEMKIPLQQSLLNSVSQMHAPVQLLPNPVLPMQSTMRQCSTSNPNISIINDAIRQFSNDSFDVLRLPFVKYANVETREETEVPQLTKVFSIASSPRPIKKEKFSFIETLPFRAVNPHNSYYHSHRNVSEYDDLSRLTRGQVLNLLKDSPVVKTVEFVNEESEKPKHVRKTDPCKLSLKTPQDQICDPTMNIARTENCSRCFICNSAIKSQCNEIYLFNKEDQKAYRSSPKKELATPLKIICYVCLNIYFEFVQELLNEKTLEENDYLIIRHNQQYLYKQMLPLPKQQMSTQKIEIKEESEIKQEKDDRPHPEIQVEIEQTNEIGEPLEESMENEATGKNSSLTPKVKDNLDTAQDSERKFNGRDKMACRFCNKVFEHLDRAVEHGTEHHMAEEKVFPCPLCEYGYQTFQWLRGHMYSKHAPTENPGERPVTPTPSNLANETDFDEFVQSPVATRTRSRKSSYPCKRKDKSKKKTKNRKKKDGDKSGESGSDREENAGEQENSDDAVWIVDSNPRNGAATRLRHADNESRTKTYPCPFCKKCFISKETLASHEARKCKGPKIIINKKSSITILDTVNFQPKNKFLEKPSKLKDKHCEQWLDESSGNIYQKQPRKIGASSDPTVMTCDDCGAAFTSKVRLKFHIQFHGPTPLLDAEGRYVCSRCPGAVFAAEAELFDHAHFAHGKRGRWACPVPGCHKTFFLRAMLTKHSRTHTDTRRYVCSECGKRFLDKQTLDEHGVTHLKTKPFQCHICLKQLTRRSRLRMHLRAHEERLTPRALHACRRCARAFKNLEEATEHATNSACAEILKNSGDKLQQAGDEMYDAMMSDDTDYEEHTGHLLRSEDSHAVRDMVAAMSEHTRRLVRVVETEKVFRCEYCEDVFYLTDSLNKHRAIHRGDKNPFTCHICHVSFPTYSRCTTHKTTHGYFKRAVADRDRPRGQRDAAPAAGGIVGYGDFPVVKHFLCEDCGRSYLHWTYLQVHRRMKHTSSSAVYTCVECDLAFPNSWGLSYHKRKLHGNGVKGNGKIASAVTHLRFPCRDCDVVLGNKTALSAHRRKEHPDRLAYNRRLPELYACGLCGQCYGGAGALEAHVRAGGACAAAASYACASCGDTFPAAPRLADHLFTAHKVGAGAAGAGAASPGRHACAHCGKVFRTWSQCAEHVRVHTGERPYVCDVCGVAFRRLAARNHHRLGHGGERFACAHCPRRFRARAEMRAHARARHPQTVVVLEMDGLNPAPEEVIAQLHMNDIALHQVVEIAKVSFPKGGAEAPPEQHLESLRPDDESRAWSEAVMAAIGRRLAPAFAARDDDYYRRGRGARRRDGRDAAGDADVLHVEIKDVAVDELTQLLGGVMTDDGVGMLLSSGRLVLLDQGAQQARAPAQYADCQYGAGLAHAAAGLQDETNIQVLQSLYAANMQNIYVPPPRPPVEPHLYGAPEAPRPGPAEAPAHDLFNLDSQQFTNQHLHENMFYQKETLYNMDQNNLENDYNMHMRFNQEFQNAEQFSNYEYQPTFEFNQPFQSQSNYYSHEGNFETGADFFAGNNFANMDAGQSLPVIDAFVNEPKTDYNGEAINLDIKMGDNKAI